MIFQLGTSSMNSKLTGEGDDDDDDCQNKENNVFKDALGVKGLGFKSSKLTL